MEQPPPLAISSTPPESNISSSNPSRVTNEGNNGSNHRRLFLGAILGSTTDSSRKETHKHSLMTPMEYNEYILTLQYWNMKEGHTDHATGTYISQHDFRRSLNRSWYNTAKLHRVNTVTAADGTTTDILERKDESTNVWKRVVHTGNVFDALWEIHTTHHHQKLDATKNKIDMMYWNISERICRKFIQTCPECNTAKTTDAAFSATKKTQQNNWLHDRYIAFLFDRSDDKQADEHGIEMSYILAIHDKIAYWTILRPLSKIDKQIIQKEILTMICIKGYPRYLGKKHIMESATTLTSNILHNHNSKELTSTSDVVTNGRTTTSDEYRKVIENKIQQTIKTQSNWVINMHLIMLNLNYRSHKTRDMTPSQTGDTHTPASYKHPHTKKNRMYFSQDGKTKTMSPQSTPTQHDTMENTSIHKVSCEAVTNNGWSSHSADVTNPAYQQQANTSTRGRSSSFSCTTLLKEQTNQRRSETTNKTEVTQIDNLHNPNALFSPASKVFDVSYMEDCATQQNQQSQLVATEDTDNRFLPINETLSHLKQPHEDSGPSPIRAVINTTTLEETDPHPTPTIPEQDNVKQNDTLPWQNSEQSRSMFVEPRQIMDSPHHDTTNPEPDVKKSTDVGVPLPNNATTPPTQDTLSQIDEILEEEKGANTKPTNPEHVNSTQNETLSHQDSCQSGTMFADMRQNMDPPHHDTTNLEKHVAKFTDEGVSLPNKSTTPPTQDTHTQIVEILEEEELAKQTKSMYDSYPLDIRSFFVSKPTIPEHVDDEVMIVSPSHISEHPFTQQFSREFYRGYSVKQAFSLGKTITKTIDNVPYRLCQPKIVCRQCDTHAPPRVITVGEESYYELYNHSQRWFFPDIVTTFGILSAHDTHRDDMMYVDSTLPTQPIDYSRRKAVPLPSKVQSIISVAYNNFHYAVLRIIPQEGFVYIYDGLSRPIEGWQPNIYHVLNQYGMGNAKWNMKLGEGTDGMDGVTIHQTDQNNCGPIACMVLWKLFHPETVNLAAIRITEYRQMSLRLLRMLLDKHDDVLILHKRIKREKEMDHATKSAHVDPPTTACPRLACVEHSIESREQTGKTENNFIKSTNADGMAGITIDTETRPRTKSDDVPNKLTNTRMEKEHTTRNIRKNVWDRAPMDEDQSCDGGLFDSEEDIEEYKKGDDPKSKKSMYPKKKDENQKPNESSQENKSALTIEKRQPVYDGLTSSDEEDDNFMDSVTEKKKVTNRKRKKPIPYVANPPPYKKSRIKVTIPKSKTSVLRSKCKCKNGCNNQCGCYKKKQKCGPTCTCRGNCTNN